MERIVLIHGDVTLYEAKSIPKTAKRIDFKKGFILEKGEGVHTHTIENECEVYLDEKTGRMYLKEVSGKIKVNHEEHGLKEIETKTGIVYKDLEQEFDYEGMEARNTRD